VVRVGVKELYADGRGRLLDLAMTLGPPEAAMPVIACPEWTVKDVYAHLAGVCGDILAGRLEGVATDPWTEAQVSARAGVDLPEVIHEWRSVAETFDAVLTDAMPPPLIIDLWTHEQDVRGTVGAPGGRSAPQVVYGLAALATGFGSGWTDRPAVRIVGDSGEWVLGEGPVAATLRASDFELVRAMMGRRSRAQFVALDWEGDGDAFVDHLHAFGYAAADVVE
jgi:uncharacterized protein (TIGR03083 family)